MEDEFEAMKLFKYQDMHLFLVGPRIEPHILGALKRLEQDDMIFCSWNHSKVHPMDCELTKKGYLLREYLQNNEWD